MINTRLIEAAVKIVIDYYEAEGIYEATDTIRKRAIDWYSHTEIVDAYELAAVTISGSFESGLKYNEIQEITRFFFPEPLEEMNTYAEYILIHDNYSMEEIKGCDLNENWWS